MDSSVETQLIAQFKNLQNNSEEIISSDNDDNFIKYLLGTKIKSNITVLREQAVVSQNLSQYQLQYSALNFDLSLYLNKISSNLETKADIQETAVRNKEETETVETIISKEDQESFKKEDLKSLRKRLFHRNTEFEDNNNNNNDIVEETNQQQLIDELGKLTSTLKQNAQEFNKQLTETDSDVLKKTEQGLSSTSAQVRSLGTKLGQFSKSKLGIMFYLTCLISMFVGLLLTYAIIKIFPEL
ncbi:uncharacterized protein SCODWIG_02716 [Saccharomycodes ludwigii]|uniref:Protein transport protein USE1 n=1 Tax=Saccharomycodes ludwigii TaxID=36035 RepID=A0A376B8F7_9ASCO|nr:hypothetical protein SCDLUD_001043 [Saccharomycodes ludwigii]KAH3903407.1 hypothetical protein SCDLUD_001043 [Saccharomycodes ludwigii]SSD60955.1 uncharacterized protein SCODWIG_02716 [Saccharomycodes ludwigii]